MGRQLFDRFPVRSFPSGLAPPSPRADFPRPRGKPPHHRKRARMRILQRPLASGHRRESRASPGQGSCDQTSSNSDCLFTGYRACRRSTMSRIAPSRRGEATKWIAPASRSQNSSPANSRAASTTTWLGAIRSLAQTVNSATFAAVSAVTSMATKLPRALANSRRHSTSERVDRSSISLPTVRRRAMAQASVRSQTSIRMGTGKQRLHRPCFQRSGTLSGDSRRPARARVSSQLYCALVALGRGGQIASAALRSATEPRPNRRVIAEFDFQLERLAAVDRRPARGVRRRDRGRLRWRA